MNRIKGTDCNLGRDSTCKQIIISFHQIRRSYEGLPPAHSDNFSFYPS